MARYTVRMNAIVPCSASVEASSEKEAIEKAFEGDQLIVSACEILPDIADDEFALISVKLEEDEDK